MEDSAIIASNLYDEFAGMLSHGLSRDEAEKARAGLIKWIEARIGASRTESVDAQRELVETGIPEEIRDTYGGIEPEERFELAATAFDRWYLQEMSKRAFSRAQAFLEERGDLQEMQREAESDLQEIQAIEARLADDFPYAQNATRTVTSESKLDCIYVIRGGTRATSRRLGRVIERTKSS